MNMNFDFYNPTRILFGRGKINELGNSISEMRSTGSLGKKAILLMSNGKSAKISGAYDKTVTNIKIAGLVFSFFKIFL